MISEARLNRIWYGTEKPPVWMRFLSMIFRALVFVRRSFYRANILSSRRFSFPVIVVGNVTAGGTGKTPLAIALIEYLKQLGFRPGFVSRGYGGNSNGSPIIVARDTQVAEAGDEPVLVAQRTGVPVVVHRNRVKAVEALIAAHPVDVIVCDDGLQHYALDREVEIAVIDGSRGLGNERLLPAGPLREPLYRLQSVDHVVINGTAGAGLPVAGTQMTMQPSALVNLLTGERREAGALQGSRCIAIAGIGNPQRFFTTLGELGYDAECRAFPDHHPFVPADLAFAGGRTLIMTEKDAVKCRTFAEQDWWYLEVSARLDGTLFQEIIESIAPSRRTEGTT